MNSKIIVQVIGCIHTEYTSAHCILIVLLHLTLAPKNANFRCKFYSCVNYYCFYELIAFMTVTESLQDTYQTVSFNFMIRFASLLRRHLNFFFDNSPHLFLHKIMLPSE